MAYHQMAYHLLVLVLVLVLLMALLLAMVLVLVLAQVNQQPLTYILFLQLIFFFIIKKIVNIF
jgi:hypothetical protein